VGIYFVYYRPFLREFIDDIQQFFDLAVWTASNSRYALSVTNNIFKPGELKFVFSGERCTRRIDSWDNQEIVLKRLKKVRKFGYPLFRTLVVDDKPETFQDNYGNGIQIQEFNGDLEDKELQKLLGYLHEIMECSNYREIEKRGWQLRF
jgi:TFIIF-interacting CTD phosphatase-like protein